ncbi:MAG: alpha-glucan phosphorylase [Phototrophicales bacterium]|nr:MAG: alpha-glucan phosphorylase [Phototrophicales bacterium]
MVDVSPKLPPELERLLELAYNMRWSWDHETAALFRRLDADLWVKTNYNPVWILGLIDQEKLDAAVNDTAFMASFRQVCDAYDAYMNATDTWYRTHYGEFDKPYIVYFSMEFGLATCLQNYSGGLGVLAGDHMKSASDLGLPLVGVGLLYQEGYFQQYLNQDGYQQERYPINDYSNLPVQPVYKDNGERLVITVPIAAETLHAYVWKVDIGRVQLYLLDATHPNNPPELHNLTDRLYGGDRRMRIRQEILLGIGGIRLLQALNIEPKVVHLNEGHSAFSALERIRMFMKQHPDLSFEEARNILASTSVYTIHTPVPAGLERFGYDLIDEHFPWLWKELGLTREQFHDLGREPMGDYDLFSLPVMALKMSAATNGVSRLHGEVSRNMWQWMFPEVPENEVPIGHVTNGIHVHTWLSREMANLFDRYLDPAWRVEPSLDHIWHDVERIPDPELWRVKSQRRARLVAFARARLRAQLEERGAPQSEVALADEVLNPDALTIGFARRFATYKRATLLFRDIDRLIRLVNDPERPVQFIFAGKAHPHDQPGKALIREIVHYSRMPELRHAIVFLENYDMTVARYMLQGADVWLNNPRRPKEASGTSGMKVIYNAGLNLSVLDGWWDEAYHPDYGWAIGNGEVYPEDQEELQDYIESEALYNLLEEDVIPLFYERRRDNMPHYWISKVKMGMKALAPFFTTHRMVQEYAEKYYLPSLERYERLIAKNAEAGKDFANWLINIKAVWDTIQIKHVQVSKESLTVGESLFVEAVIDLGKLTPNDVAVQLYSGKLDTNGLLIDGEAVDMTADSQSNGAYTFKGQITYLSSGERGVSVRVLPKNPNLTDPLLTGLILWASPDVITN